MENQEDKGMAKIFSGIRNRIIAGLFVVIPLLLTVWISWFIYSKLTAWAVFLVASVPSLKPYEEAAWFTQSVRVASLIIMVAILFLIGQLASHKIGKYFIKFMEWIVNKVPILNTIYSTIHQIGDALFSAKGGMFRKVVLFEYPRKGLYVIGFLTNENKEDCELKEKTGEDELISVFLPTTPNPTSGFLLFVPRKDCVYLNMSVAEGMRLVISGGAVSGKSLNHDHMPTSEAEEGNPNED